VTDLPRLRQAVIAAHDLEAVCDLLRRELRLGEPFRDPGVGWFGLQNAVFALGDTFLEVVSPVREGTTAGRRLARSGGDCGYMAMFQVEDVAAARARAAAAGVREVFEVELDDISEVHLHPADMEGAIVSLSQPTPPTVWRWGGPDWPARAASLHVAGIGVWVSDPDRARERWRSVIGALPGVEFEPDAAARGIVEIAIEGAGRRESLQIGQVRLAFDR
jgi:hypothetical protein